MCQIWKKCICYGLFISICYERKQSFHSFSRYSIVLTFMCFTADLYIFSICCNFTSFFFSFIYHLSSVNSFAACQLYDRYILALSTHYTGNMEDRSESCIDNLIGFGHNLNVWKLNPEVPWTVTGRTELQCDSDCKSEDRVNLTHQCSYITIHNRQNNDLPSERFRTT